MTNVSTEGLSSQEILNMAEAAIRQAIQSGEKRKYYERDGTSATSVNQATHGKKAKSSQEKPNAGKFCKLHKTTSHSDAECRSQQKTGSSTPPTQAATGLQPKKTGKRKVKQTPDHFESMKNFFLQLKEKDPVALKTIIGTVDIVPNTVLDSGAGGHVHPVGLPGARVIPNTDGGSIVDVTNRETLVRYLTEFMKQIGGNNFIFKRALAVDNVTNVILSVSQWLKGTRNGILFTADDVFHIDLDARKKKLTHIGSRDKGLYLVKPSKNLGRAFKTLRDVIRAVQDGEEIPAHILTLESDEIPQLGISESERDIFINDEVTTLGDDSKNSPDISGGSNGTDDVGDGLDKDILTLHASFGHASPRIILETINNNKVGSKKLSRNLAKLLRTNQYNCLESCIACAQGKITRNPVGYTQTPAKAILERIHTDCVPIPINRHKQEHGTLLVDELSRYIEIEFHAKKSNHFPHLTSMMEQWSRRHAPITIGAIRHDDGELQNQLDAYCDRQHPKIANETSPAYAKEFNGLSERNYAVCKATAITMLIHSNLPKSFTSYALQYAIWIKNRLRHPNDHKTSPFKMWFGYEPDLSKLKPFGCLVTYHLDLDQIRDYYGSRAPLESFWAIMVRSYKCPLIEVP